MSINVESVTVKLDVPKPIMRFFEKWNELFGESKDSIETCLLMALIDRIDVLLNENETFKQNAIKNLSLGPWIS